MPTFAFLPAPMILTKSLHRRQNAPLPIALLRVYSFGDILNARLLFVPIRSTSELLRTL
jgi:hypothetical protein